MSNQMNKQHYDHRSIFVAFYSDRALGLSKQIHYDDEFMGDIKFIISDKVFKNCVRKVSSFEWLIERTMWAI